MEQYTQNPTEDYEIVVEVPKKVLIRDIITNIVTAILGVVFICFYFYFKSKNPDFKGGKFASAGILSLILAVCLLVKNLYLLPNGVIAIFNDNGVYLSRKRKWFSWDEIKILKFTRQLKNVKGEIHTINVMECELNDGQCIKSNITKSKCVCEALIQEIKSKFPQANCNFMPL